MHIRQLLLLLLSFIGFDLCAQTEMSVTVTITDRGRQPVAGALIRLTEQHTARKLEARTAGDGTAALTITEAGTWRITINGHDPGQEPMQVADNEHGSMAYALTYSPEIDLRKRLQTFDRNGFTEKEASLRLPDRPERGWNLIEIQVVSSKGQRQKGKRVALVDLQARTLHTAFTGADGSARFHLPGAHKYDIDVEEHRNAGHLLMEDRVNSELMQVVVYDSYELMETRRGDTITQAFRLPVTQKASRALYRIAVTRAGKPWRKGTVYLDATGSRDVYVARTDSTGTACFLLPFGVRYLVHFPYQRDVEVVNLREARQEASGSTELAYKPDPALEFPERFLPRPEQLTLTHFRYYHKTPYPPGTNGRPTLVGEALPHGRDALLHFGLGGALASGNRRLPLNLAFVIDISGSMAGGDRIESLKRGLLKLLPLLRNDDRIALITFESDHALLLPSQPVAGAQTRIRQAIESLEPKGGTNMLEALRIGYRTVNEHYSARSDNRVVVLSDGFDDNPSDTLVAAQRPWRERIPCQAIGVGEGYNAELLDRLANYAAPRQARQGAELEQFLSGQFIQAQPLAEAISVELLVPPGVRCDNVYGLDSLKRTGNSITGKLPGLLIGDDLPCLARFSAGTAAHSDVTFPVTIRVRYRSAASSTVETQERIVPLRFGENAVTNTALPETEKILAIAFCNESLLTMARYCEASQYAQAKKSVSDALQRIRKEQSWLNDGDVRALERLLSKYEEVLVRTLNKR